jgi:hypothetical protein
MMRYISDYVEALLIGASLLDARPGGGVTDPPEDLEYDVVEFEVLRVDSERLWTFSDEALWIGGDAH